MTRLVSGEREAEPAVADRALRPQTLAEFTGQAPVKANLRVYIDAARARGEALDHVLLFGPPGLGKTTLAQIVARELGVGFRPTSGPLISKPADLAALLTGLESHDILFIDEVHRLPPVVEEILYSAMEDGHLDLMIGEGPSARSVRISLEPFTLVAATTRAGLLSKPLRDRFGIPLRLEFYSSKELGIVLSGLAQRMGIRLTQDGAAEIATRARGTPRVAGRLLRRVRDFADAQGEEEIGKSQAAYALERLEVDQAGLDALDRRYLLALINTYGGGPAGGEAIAGLIAESRDAVEDVIEPYLLQQGYVLRTPRGRVANAKAYEHLGLGRPTIPPQPGLFEDG